MEQQIDDSQRLGEEINEQPNEATQNDQPEMTPQMEENIVNKLKTAFWIFESNTPQLMDLIHIGTLLKYLDIYISEAKTLEIAKSIESSEEPGKVKLEKFVEVAFPLVLNQTYKKESKERLMSALKVFDVERKGYLTIEDLKSAICLDEEGFSQEEFEEMMAVAVDPIDGHIYFEAYADKLLSV